MLFVFIGVSLGVFVAENVGDIFPNIEGEACGFPASKIIFRIFWLGFISE